MSPPGVRTWGEDLLGREMLLKGYEYKISITRCGLIDVKLVDEDEDTCVLPRVDICNTNQRWILDDDSLLLCELSSP
jgi:hypothetical protein